MLSALQLPFRLLAAGKGKAINLWFELCNYLRLLMVHLFTHYHGNWIQMVSGYIIA